MLIERHDIGNVLFQELDEGEVFVYDNIPYMKIQNIENGRGHLGTVIDCNAVCLCNGTVELFEKNNMVCARPNSYVVIK